MHTHTHIYIYRYIAKIKLCEGWGNFLKSSLLNAPLAALTEEYFGRKKS